MPTGIYKRNVEQHNRLLECQKMAVEALRGKHRQDMIGDKNVSKRLEVRNKISIANKGRVAPNKGKHLSAEWRAKIGNANRGENNGYFGKKHTAEEKDKISLSQKGSLHWNWLGGISNNPYPREFTPELKLKIRTRDNFTCCLCGRTEREELEELNRVLCVNHINFDKNDCREENLNTLCQRCNIKINRDREYWTDYFNTLNKLQ